MLNRRAFLGGSIATALATPLAARAQQVRETARVGFLTPTGRDSPTTVRNRGAFLERLSELSWIESRNLIIETRYAEGKYERLPTLAMELVNVPVDVIFANSAPAAIAAKQATRSIPIVFETLGDPISAGLVSSLATPGGNITGVSGLGPELSGKRLEILKELVPGLQRVILLLNPSNVMAPPTLRSTEQAAAALGLKIQIAEVRAPADIETVFAGLNADRRTAMIVVPDPMLSSQARRVQALLVKHKLPAVHNETSWLQEGGLILFGSNQRDHFRQGASLVDKVLRGAHPGNLPVEQSTKFELIVNVKTARAVGLTIPPSLLLRADQVIE